MKNPVTKETIWEAAPESLDISLNELDHIPDADDSIEFHSARIMLLIYFAGGERAKRIDGRTKLAKLDFFVRYPAFLAQAAHLKGVPNTINVKVKPDSKMIRYKYGPWDAKYYDIFAYLVAKDFLNITPDSKKRHDIFELTEKGKVAVGELNGSEFSQIVDRCKLAAQVFHGMSGSQIKDFIYTNFMNIANMPLGEVIGTEDAE